MEEGGKEDLLRVALRYRMYKAKRREREREEDHFSSGRGEEAAFYRARRCISCRCDKSTPLCLREWNIPSSSALCCCAELQKAR